jgi:hypothetical protein
MFNKLLKILIITLLTSILIETLAESRLPRVRKTANLIYRVIDVGAQKFAAVRW